MRRNLKNHADRAEFIEAMGLRRRRKEAPAIPSTLLEKPDMYVARRLKDGSVLRISIGVATVGHLVAPQCCQPFVTVLAVALLLSLLLWPNYLSKRIVETA